ncbi:MAG: hypothetical protein CME70_18770 [Halobacteriovorax sp.]|nr:hypothetical protein [Halobacteriovorax sp.]|tara:strand:+ start:888 stop:1694 length:807 start_codon:yes stop_codon:yes gene_type:complete
MDQLVLFDMDGTITPHRKQIEEDMVNVLTNLMSYTHVGIVSGSGFDYIKEQCSALWESKDIDLDKLTILPCNGTQKYIFDGTTRQPTRVYNANMKSEIGELSLKKLIRSILSLQSSISVTVPDLPLSGTFIQYRGSLLNWCMIGRDFEDNDRSKFIDIDNKTHLRKNLLTKLQRSLIRNKVKNITMALGGQCSIDIYPRGWDKTYALQHFENVGTTWFVGDKCREGGNDFAIYKALRPMGTSYEVDMPENTIRLINELIIPHIKEKNE